MECLNDKLRASIVFCGQNKTARDEVKKMYLKLGGSELELEKIVDEYPIEEPIFNKFERGELQYQTKGNDYLAIIIFVIIIYFTLLTP